MGRPELLVIDLDGTLLDPAGEVSEDNREALGRARAAGLHLVIATGRALSECRHVLQTIGYDGALVSASGSLLVDVASASTTDRRTICPSLVEPVVSEIDGGGTPTLMLKDREVAGVDYVIVGDHDLHPVSDWWFEHTGATWLRVSALQDDPAPEATVRVGAVGTPDEFGPVVGRIADAHGDALLARHWEAVTSSAHADETIHLLEVFHPEADKWTMVQSHCAQVGLSAARSAAVGDGLNDVLLIEQCGLGVAMENADHRVLAVADAVTDANHRHGVARLIDDLLSGRLALDGGGA